MGWILMQPATDKGLQHASHYLKKPGIVCSTCHPMAIGFNLSHLAPVTVLILNANIIPLSVKSPATNGASDKIAHISEASIFGGYVTVQI